MAWSEGHFTFLDLTLQPPCLISCTSWCYFRKLWTVSRGDFCTILIDPFNRYWIQFSYKLLVWGEGYCTVWCNRVSSLAWNRFLFASICEGWLDCFINWNQWISTLESWSTSLWKALRACASCVSARWNHFFHHRLVLDCNRSAVGIHTSQFKLWCFTLELFVWCEGHLAICVHFELTNIWNFLHSCSIVK
ncbi:hypothetical protein SORDD27_01450 [Streptococcus oralis]|uniref:Uncharacterized protein n=1 Tax=Streptococcus oralis TaxID=1303 RepID=A0A139PVC1_STROR|nr:hypothetical protein SORDD27_01450 [Streptococcus oralis]